MIIGFTEKSRRVSEGLAPLGYDVFLLPIGLATMRTAERDHPMLFRLQEVSSSAIVEPLAAQTDPLLDAAFGNSYDPIEVFFVLDALEDHITSLITFIRDDRRPEDEESFTIRIFPVDVPGRRELFACNEDYSGVDNYFCQTEICIMDDDGRFGYVANSHNYNAIFRAICCWVCGDS